MIDWEKTVREIRRTIRDLDKCIRRARRHQLCSTYGEIIHDAENALNRLDPILLEIEDALPVDPFPEPRESVYARRDFPAVSQRY